MSGSKEPLVPEGYKQSEVGVIPESWEVVPLGEAVTFLDGKRVPVKSSDRAKMRGTYRYYGASGVVDFVDDYIFEGSYILLGEDGENILSRNLPLAFRVDGKFWVNNHAHVLKPSEAFNIDYLTAFLESLDYTLLNSGTAQPKLNKKSCLSISVASPPATEQTAIANALSDVDALITSLEKLIAKKRAMKTAAMQQLLTGKKRLPPFDQSHTGYKQTELGEIPEDWEVRSFSEMAVPKSRRVNPKVSGGGGFCVELEHIDQGTGQLNGSTITTSESSLKAVFSEGDVLFGKLRSYLRKYWLADKDGLCSTEVWVLEAKEQHAIPQYIFQLVQTDGFIECSSESYGTHMPRSDWKVVKSFLVAAPSIDEQMGISNVLSEMVDEIQLLQQRVNKTQQLKQGMMQELLTGRTRLL